MAVVTPIVQMRKLSLGRGNDLFLVTAGKWQSWHASSGLFGFQDHHWVPPPLSLMSDTQLGGDFQKPRHLRVRLEQNLMALGDPEL